MLKRIFKYLMMILTGFVVLSLSWVMLYKFIPVKWTPLMLKRSIQNIEQKDYRNNRTWVDLEDISPAMVRAVIASEDGRFM